MLGQRRDVCWKGRFILSVKPKIEGFELHSLLGQGGMGQVYAGIEEATGKKVAIKLLQGRSTFSDKELAGRFLRETKVCRQLSHPNVVSYVADGQTEDGFAYLIMELVAGQSLHQFVKKGGPLDEKSWLQLAKDSAQALVHCHEKGLLHRDLKPDNIMLNEAGRGVIIDFGLVQADTMTRLTATGMIMGTVECMAPEQLRGEKLDDRTDIYSLGVTLHFALTGKWLRSRNELLAALQKGSLRTKEIGHPIVRKCCAIEKDSRYQSAKELLQALTQFASATPLKETIQVKKTTAATAPPATQKQKGSKAWPLMTLFILLLIGAYIAFFPADESAIDRKATAQKFLQQRKQLLARKKVPSRQELESFGKLVRVHSKTESDHDEETCALVHLSKRAKAPLKRELQLQLIRRKGLRWHKEPYIMAIHFVQKSSQLGFTNRVEEACAHFLKSNDQAEVRLMLAWLLYFKSSDTQRRKAFSAKERRQFLQEGISLLEPLENDVKTLLRLPKMGHIYARMLKELDDAKGIIRVVQKWQQAKLGPPFPWGEVYSTLAAALRRKDLWTKESSVWLLKAWQLRREMNKSSRWDVIDKLVVALTGLKQYEKALNELDKEKLENFNRDNHPEVLLHRVRLLKQMGRKMEARVNWDLGYKLIRARDTSLALEYNLAKNGL